MKVKSLLKIALGICEIKIQETEWGKPDEDGCRVGKPVTIWEGRTDDIPLKYAEMDLKNFHIFETLKTNNETIFGRYKIIIHV